MLQLPEVEHTVGVLDKVIANLSDEMVRDYAAEAVDCLRFGALRACVVFLWAGAIRTIQSRLISHHRKALSAATPRHDSKARAVTSLDHFAYIWHATTLQVAQDLGVIDKNEKTILNAGLDLRNACGHPGKCKLGPAKVAGFIEDVVGIVF